ncbi:MAG: DUF5107 domain-containing protein, partial [bacterium]|nr:DUF5107 domain-containing protein [bacterium]
GHGKRYVKPWPVYDGVDHRWYRNLKSSYSVFTEGSTEDFFGCYSHDKNAGTVVVGDHRTAPGKKYFSWGSHPAGRRWDTLLSDEDGPYIELQVGAFWENLGYGYAWLDPMEVKKYTIYWYPVKDLGGFVRANEHLALNLKRDGESGAMLGVQAVHAHPGNSIRVTAGDRAIYEKTLDLGPAKPFVDKFELASGVRYEDLKVTIRCKKGNVLMTYQPLVKHPPAPELPAPRVAPEKAAT